MYATEVPVHLKGEDGTWAASAVELNQDPEYWSGGQGLHATPRDYLKFQRALLNGGDLDGRMILQEKSITSRVSRWLGRCRPRSLEVERLRKNRVKSGVALPSCNRATSVNPE